MFVGMVMMIKAVTFQVENLELPRKGMFVMIKALIVQDEGLEFHMNKKYPTLYLNMFVMTQLA